MALSLVIFPKITFEQICRDLEALSWNRQPDTMITPPILPGEPELAEWTHRSGTDRIVYTFNPVVYLRVLAFYGKAATQSSAQVARVLPTLGVVDVRDLLRSTDVRQLLLGIFAAGELDALPLMGELDALRTNPEPMVAEAAKKTHGQLVQLAVQQGMVHLAAEKARHPDRSVLFPWLGGDHERRQIVRWLIHDYTTANDDIQATLSTAMEDEDWEVRATAMLAAVRLRVKPLTKAVRRVELPSASREGLDKTDRHILVAARKSCLALLSGQPVPEEPDSPPATRENMQAHLMRCVAGLPVKWHERVFLLVYALTQPLPEIESLQPADLPQWIIVEDEAYSLAKARIELVWVPPIPHWLGDELDKVPIENPIRQVTPNRGFFIAREPLMRDGRMISLDEARQWCDELSGQSGAAVRLPTGDEWEMAARGPDGRRFPWGNAYECKGPLLPSPWGAMKMVGIAPQWTATVIGDDQVVCGGKKQIRCSIRGRLSANAVAAFRPLVPANVINS